MRAPVLFYSIPTSYNLGLHRQGRHGALRWRHCQYAGNEIARRGEGGGRRRLNVHGPSMLHSDAPYLGNVLLHVSYDLLFNYKIIEF